MTDTQQQQNPALPGEEKEKRVGSGAGTGRASGRLPGLEDLAARMNITPPTNTTSASSRPRLATSLLRTNSGTGTTVGGGGSGTGPPSASSDKPTESQIPLPAVSISVSDPNGEEVKPSKPMPRGYKNVPSLDAIAGRLKAQKEKEKEQQEPSGKSGDESGSGAVELEQGEIEEGKSEVDTSVLHPLRHKWTFYFDSKPPPPRTTGESPVPYTPSNTETGEYEAGLKVVGKFRTVEDFCRLFNWLKPPSKLERSSNYHMFKEDIKPMWEDPANANGGKWVITMRNNPVLLDRCWSWLAMGLVGQELDDREDMICGAVVSLRSRIDRIQLWIRQKDDVERVNAIGKKLVKLLDLDREPGIQLEFQVCGGGAVLDDLEGRDGVLVWWRFTRLDAVIPFAHLLCALFLSYPYHHYRHTFLFWLSYAFGIVSDQNALFTFLAVIVTRLFNSDERAPASKYISIMPPQPSFRRGPDTPGSEQGPSYFGRGGGAFGAFGRGGGAFGGAGRGKGDWGAPKSAVEGSAPFGANAGAGHARSSSASGTGDK
ncbi:Eukaryotic initiation factor 4E, partial [Rhizoctonia solani]